jgi:hypothetical protein
MNLRPGLYAQRRLSFVLLLLWCGFATSALLLASLGERDPRWLADNAPLYLSRQRLSRTRRAIIPKVARRLWFPFETTFQHRALLHGEET